jgi:hypothetical protein
MPRPLQLLHAAGAALCLVVLPASAGASTIGVLQQLAPASINYVQGIDFLTFVPDNLVGTGDVMAPLESAGTGSVADFLGFTSGNIALVVRDPLLTFGQKVENATAAGAAAVLIYNNEAGLPLAVQFQIPTTIPALFITQSLGQSLLGPTTLEMRVAVEVVPDPVPEPATALLVGAGLALASARRRFANRPRR